MNQELGELQRIVAGMIRYGVVSGVSLGDATAPRVTVDTAGLSSDWLPWCAGRAGAVRKWSPPTVGEQVIVLTPDGDPSQAVVIPGFYQSAHASPSTSPDKDVTLYPDGTLVEYDSAQNEFKMVVAGAAKVTVICQQAVVQAGTSVTLDSPQTTCTGALTVQGLLTYQDGIAGTGGGNGHSISGGLNVTGGDVTVDGIGVKSHHHTAQGANAATTAAQA